MPGPGVGLGAAAALLLTAPAVGTVLLLGPGSPAAAAGASSCGLAGAGSHLYTGEQLTEQMWTDANSIVQTTTQAGLPPRAAVIAVATSLQEARLLPITHGDLAGPTAWACTSSATAGDRPVSGWRPAPPPCSWPGWSPSPPGSTCR